MIKGKHIVLGISGSIAAYKACTLIRLLVKEGAEVQVVITPSGKEFITPVTLSALTSKPVISHFFGERDGSWHSHVDIGQWADLMVIAPATASSIAKMAHGVADNMLITTYLSMKAPVMIAPAMDLDMYAHPSTQANIATLRSYGNIIIEPSTGELASHLVGKGRMQEPQIIFEQICNFFSANQRLAGKKILITAGPTYEKIDPVRFIGNYSSGKMGFALAESCAKQGAEVYLVCGPVHIEVQDPSIKRINVISAADMYAECMKLFPLMDAAILSAAVADFTPQQTADKKIKRGTDNMYLQLQPTHDIAAALGKMKKEHQRLVGFALETHEEVENAKLKMNKKNLDFIVLNSLNDKGAGFSYDTNKITIIGHNQIKEYPLKHKNQVAEDITTHLCEYL